MSERLGLPSLPEMVFGKNRFVLEESSSGLRLEFSAEEALKMVSHAPPTDVKVAASDKWAKSNKGQVEKLKAEKEYSSNAETQDFDWTFTTYFSGKFTHDTGDSQHTPSDFVPRVVSEGLDEKRDCIPMEKLRSTSEPILYFSHVHLFEDEIHDNGVAELSTKSRVMSSFWFCLVRFWLRVDGVLFRVIDHRLYHEFGRPHIIRETSVREGSWAEVNERVEGDLKKIRDPTEFVVHLRPISSTLEHIILPTK